MTTKPQAAQVPVPVESIAVATMLLADCPRTLLTVALLALADVIVEIREGRNELPPANMGAAELVQSIIGSVTDALHDNPECGRSAAVAVLAAMRAMAAMPADQRRAVMAADVPAGSSTTCDADSAEAKAAAAIAKAAAV